MTCLLVRVEVKGIERVDTEVLLREEGLELQDVREDFFLQLPLRKRISGCGSQSELASGRRTRYASTRLLARSETGSGSLPDHSSG